MLPFDSLNSSHRKCGIKVAAAPGKSNHNGGLAIDIQNAYDWYLLTVTLFSQKRITALQANNWKKLGDYDPMHYDYVGSDGVDVRALSVLGKHFLHTAFNGF